MTRSPVQGDDAGAELELLTELVRRRSITPADDGCQQLLAGRLEAAGFACESLPFGEVSNLWARRGDTGPVVCFAGHTDVVPVGDPDAWHSDPFEPQVRNGNLHGRGAADMKSGLAAMVVAVERFLEHNREHNGSIAFLITSDEEGDARDGTLKVVETLQARGEHIDWCLVGEPSSSESLGDVIRIGRRGSLSGEITVNGVQGHVAYPQLADNPIARFTPALAELLSTEWDAGNEYFPPTSFQVVEIQSGIGAANVTPAELTAKFNVRYSTEWDAEGLKRKIESLLNDHELDYRLKWHLSGEPFLTGPGVLIDETVAAIRELTGTDPELSTGGGTSDGRFISPAGTDVVELGPVNATIHKVNEHVSLNDVTTLARIYQQILERLLT